MQVVVVTPNEVDATLAAEQLARPDIEVIPCAQVSELCATVGTDIGCLVLVEESLGTADLEALQSALATQPTWSDLPLLLITSQGTSLAALVDRVYPLLGNVTMLQRPLHPMTLISAVNMALRSRQRQYEVRDLLDQRTRALKQRDEFLAMLAHELRNPLAPIRYAAHILKRWDIPDKDFATCRAMIEKQALHMTRLVDDLLEVSRLELGKVSLRRESIDLNEVARAAIESCAPITAARRHNVSLRPAREPLVISGDAVRLEQVFGNLIVNAAKFTPAGGRIAIETRRDGDSGVVSVTDNGRGIREDMLDAVFDLFVQETASLDRSEGGLGIGLTLVKRLVDMHGGRVGVQSDGIGKGARFEVAFPLAGPAQAGSPRTDELASSPKRILVVEDAEEVRESLRMLLVDCAHDVTCASDGLEGLRQARELQPDIAIIDIGLPGINGYELARRIREGPLPWSRQVKLLALTGYGRAEDRERTRQAGFDQHLLKPVEPDALQRMLMD